MTFIVPTSDHTFSYFMFKASYLLPPWRRPVFEDANLDVSLKSMTCIIFEFSRMSFLKFLKSLSKRDNYENLIQVAPSPEYFQTLEFKIIEQEKFHNAQNFIFKIHIDDIFEKILLNVL